MWTEFLIEISGSIVAMIGETFGKPRQPVQCVHGEHIIILKDGDRVCAKCGVKESKITT